MNLTYVGPIAGLVTVTVDGRPPVEGARYEIVCVESQVAAGGCYAQFRLKRIVDSDAAVPPQGGSQDPLVPSVTVTNNTAAEASVETEGAVKRIVLGEMKAQLESGGPIVSALEATFGKRPRGRPRKVPAPIVGLPPELQ